MRDATVYDQKDPAAGGGLGVFRCRSAASSQMGSGAVDQLDQRGLGAVALAEAGLQDAQVAARPLGHLRPDLVEQRHQHVAVVDLARRLPLGVKVALLGQRDQLLGVRAELLGLGLGGLDPAVLEQARGHVPHQRLLVRGGAPQGAPLVVVPHRYSSSPASPAPSVWPPSLSESTQYSVPSSDCSSSCPKRSPWPARNSLISCSDFLPKLSIES